MKNSDIETWLMISHALFRSLMPEDLWHEISDMQSADIDRQAGRVNAALISMSLAAGEPEVRQIFSSIDRETVIALCSRWIHYHKVWQSLLSETEPYLWIPPDQRDLWRAILLAMTDDTAAASAACIRLWPELRGASRV